MSWLDVFDVILPCIQMKKRLKPLFSNGSCVSECVQVSFFFDRMGRYVFSNNQGTHCAGTASVAAADEWPRAV